MQTDPSASVSFARVCARFNDLRDKHKFVLRDISFVVPRGSFVSVIGPSGSGKSTLLRVLLGLMPHTSGEIVRGFKRPAMIFQNYALFPWLTTLENASFGPRMDGKSKEESQKIGKEKLREVGLEHFAEHYPAELSGGQRQRVSIARALALNPDLLVMDEPFSNLDTVTAEELKRDVLRLWKQYNMTVIMVNHLIPDAVELSDTIVVMSGNPGEIKKMIAVDLPRPRDVRHPHFFHYVDELITELRVTP